MSSSERFIRGILVTLAEAAATNAAERVRAETEWGVGEYMFNVMSGPNGGGVKGVKGARRGQGLRQSSL